jgi:hypothetical protein
MKKTGAKRIDIIQPNAKKQMTANPAALEAFTFRNRASPHGC